MIWGPNIPGLRYIGLSGPPDRGAKDVVPNYPSRPGLPESPDICRVLKTLSLAHAYMYVNVSVNKTISLSFSLHVAWTFLECLTEGSGVY